MNIQVPFWLEVAGAIVGAVVFGVLAIGGLILGLHLVSQVLRTF